MTNGPADVTVDFSAATQSLGALQAAAYRLIGTATCEIDKAGERWVVRLSTLDQSTNKKQPLTAEALRVKFLDLVADENLRERIAMRTEGVRNVILSLAFGAIANQPNS